MQGKVKERLGFERLKSKGSAAKSEQVSDLVQS